ncbi:MAG: hypothetical protein MK082_13495 [Phycisphaerales bacterium]|nr:hypothetical protein [Phycisphaerales bacterium]
MTVPPEDLAGLLGEIGKRSKGLVEVRQVYRDVPLCLACNEENDLVDHCHDLDEFLDVIYVYDMMLADPV